MPGRPIDWPVHRKWLVTIVSCITCLLVGLNALSIASAASVINEEFGISDENFPNSYWPVTSWEVGAAIMPMAGLPLLEDFGVRKGYLMSYVLFVLFVIPQALAQNFATLIVCRFFAGGFASVVMNAVENVIADLWPGVSNCLPMALFMLVYLEGFTLGPVIGSAILAHSNWRWIFYIELIIYCAIFPVLFFTVSETRDASNVTAKSERSFWGIFTESILRPAQLFFTEPVVFFFTLWLAFAMGMVFLATQSIVQVYGTNYGFNDIQCGYIQASLAIGFVVGFPLCLAQNKFFLSRQTPESRLPYSIPASFLGLAGGLFVYAWTSYATLPWIAPSIGLGMVGVGIILIAQCGLTYLTDAYGIYAASALAACAAMENTMSAFLPLAAQKMYSTLGFEWAGSVVAFLALALSFAPLVLWLKGPVIRGKSKFMNRKQDDEESDR